MRSAADYDHARKVEANTRRHVTRAGFEKILLSLGWYGEETMREACKLAAASKMFDALEAGMEAMDDANQHLLDAVGANELSTKLTKALNQMQKARNQALGIR